MKNAIRNKRIRESIQRFRCGFLQSGREKLFDVLPAQELARAVQEEVGVWRDRGMPRLDWIVLLIIVAIGYGSTLSIVTETGIIWWIWHASQAVFGIDSTTGRTLFLVFVWGVLFFVLDRVARLCGVRSAVLQRLLLGFWQGFGSDTVAARPESISDVAKKAEEELKRTDTELNLGRHKKVFHRLPEIDKLVVEVLTKEPNHPKLGSLITLLKTQKRKVEAKLGHTLALQTDLTEMGSAFRAGDVYIDFPYESAKFRYEKASGNVFRRFYGEPEDQIPHSSELYNDAISAGKLITREEYYRD